MVGKPQPTEENEREFEGIAIPEIHYVIMGCRVFVMKMVHLIFNRMCNHIFLSYFSAISPDKRLSLVTCSLLHDSEGGRLLFIILCTTALFLEPVCLSFLPPHRT